MCYLFLRKYCRRTNSREEKDYSAVTKELLRYYLANPSPSHLTIKGTGRGFRPSRHGGVAEMRSGALSTHVPEGPRVVAYSHPAHGGYNLTIAAIR